MFTPNALPNVTFVEEHLQRKKKMLLQNLEQGGAVIAISGPSKSGKTVFVETTLGHNNLIQVSGANIGSPEELWRRVFSVIGTPIPATKAVGKFEQTAVTGSVEGTKPVQEEIATVIKEAVREGLRFVLAAVLYHADDVVIANSDLRGRMLKLHLDYWEEAELTKIAEKGFAALNVTVTPATVSAFAIEAAGSPQLMQSLCLKRVQMTSD